MDSYCEFWEECFHFVHASQCNIAKHNQPKNKYSIIQQKGEERTEGQRGRRDEKKQVGTPQSFVCASSQGPLSTPCRQLAHLFLFLSQLARPIWLPPGKTRCTSRDAAKMNCQMESLENTGHQLGWGMLDEWVGKAQTLRTGRHAIKSLYCWLCDTGEMA